MASWWCCDSKWKCYCCGEREHNVPFKCATPPRRWVGTQKETHRLKRKSNTGSCSLSQWDTTGMFEQQYGHLFSLRCLLHKDRLREGTEGGRDSLNHWLFHGDASVGPPSEVTVMFTLNPQWITDRISYSCGMREDRTEGHTLYQIFNQSLQLFPQQ